MRTPLAWKNVTHNKFRAAASLAGVSFAILLIFMQLGFFRATQRTLSWWEAFRRSKDPPTFIVVFEDSAAILGIAAAAAGAAAATLTGDGRWDGVASLGIAAILAVVLVGVSLLKNGVHHFSTRTTIFALRVAVCRPHLIQHCNLGFVDAQL